MTTSPTDRATPAPQPWPELRAVEGGPAARPDPAAPAPDPAGAPAPAEDVPSAPQAEEDAPSAGRRRAARTGSRTSARSGTKSGTKSGAKSGTRAAAKAAGSRTATRTAAKPGAKSGGKATTRPRARPAAKSPRAPRAPRAAAAPETARTETAAAAPPEAQEASLRLRHWITMLSFIVVVLAPLAATVGYLYTRAADRYHSEVAFSIRSEEAASATAGLIGALTSIGSGSASDADILYEYVRSQGIVEAIDAELDLRAIWSRADGDPVFTVAPDASIEALVAHWRRMVEVAFESSAGIVHIRAQAFTAEDAQAIADAILAQSGALVNRLSDQARADAIRFAQEEFAEAEANLRTMRQRLSAFRRENRIVDPSADVAGQMGLLNALQAELAQALVERDMLLSFVGEEDQRVIQANRRIDAVTGRIEAERASLGVSGTDGALPDVVGRYEELLVDLEFANTAYTQTLAGLSAARAEARRQSRYLAPHVRPTRAESALYPRRALLAGLAGLFLLLGWGALMLVYYNVRDNR